MKAVFDFIDFREFILFLSQEEGAKRGFHSQLAEAAKCQRSYLSQVLKYKAGLTLDHAIGIGNHLHFDDAEMEYFLNLVNYDRAGTQELKTYYLNKIQSQQNSFLDLGKRFNVSLIEDAGHEQLYYSSWHWSAVHILTGVPGFQTVQKIATRLSLPIDFTIYTLERLELMGLVKKDTDNNWFVTKGKIHLSKSSIMNTINHNNWRQRATLTSPSSELKSLNYTAVQSISRDDFEVIKKIILKAIDNTRNIVIESKQEEVACLNFDLFLV